MACTWLTSLSTTTNSAETLRHLRSLELLGKGFTPQQYEDLAIMEKQAGQQTMMVVLADLHLDRPNILEKLRVCCGTEIEKLGVVV